MAITYSPFHMGMNFRIKFSLLQGKSAHPLAEECRLYQRLPAPQGSRGRGSAGTGAQPIRTAASSNAWEAQEHWWEEKGGPGNTETVFIPFEVVCVCVSRRERESLAGWGYLLFHFRDHIWEEELKHTWPKEKGEESPFSRHQSTKGPENGL